MERVSVDRAAKEQLVADLNARFAASTVVIVTQQKGLTVAESQALRGAARKAGASYKVTKNRLAKLALKGTQFEGLADLLTGPTALATSEDPVAAAKVCFEFAKKNEKLIIVGGAMGSQMLDAKGVESLASLPSLDELRGKIVGLIQAPATKVAGVLQAPAGQLARVFSAYAAKNEAA
jgi:large subunit ribosomal protein L10